MAGTTVSGGSSRGGATTIGIVAADTTAPVISSIVSDGITTTTATITWTTDELANSQICRGAAGGPYNTCVALNPSLVLSHSELFTGLTQATTYYFVVKSTDNFANLATSTEQTFVTSSVWVPTAPSNIPSTTVPWTPGTPPGITINVSSCGTSPSTPGTLKYALANAVDGDEIVIAGSLDCTYSTVSNLSKTTSANYVMIRGQGATGAGFPARGTRLDPTNANHVLNMPRLTINGSPLELFAASANAKKYWLLGLELRYQPGVSDTRALVSASPSGGTSATTLSQNIVVDRSWLHGNPRGANNRRLVLLSGSGHVVVDSYLHDAKEASADAQCIAGWDLPTNILIENNYLSCAGENIAFGGANPAFQPATAADFIIRKNHFAAQLYWRPQDATYIGESSLFKNLLEMKCAERYQITGNVFENHFWLNQAWAITLKIAISNTANTSCVNQDYTFANNLMSGAVGAMNIFDGYDEDLGDTTLRGSRMEVKNNLFLNISKANWSPSDTNNRYQFRFGRGSQYARFSHNTTTFGSTGGCTTDSSGGSSANRGILFMGPSTTQAVAGVGADLVNNYQCQGSSIGDNSGTGGSSTADAAAFDSWMDTAQITAMGKVFFAGKSCTSWDEAWNTYSCPGDTSIFFKAVGDRTDFTDAATNDFRIAGGSNLKNAGSDGTDIGVNDWASIPNCSFVIGASAYCPIVSMSAPITATSVGGAITCNASNTTTITGTNFKRGTSVIFRNILTSSNTLLTEEAGTLVVTSPTTLTITPPTAGASAGHKLFAIYGGLLAGTNTNSWTTGQVLTMTCS